MTMIFVLGDTHFPFHHRQALQSAIDYIAQNAKHCLSNNIPMWCVQMGDLFDQYGFSRFPKKNIIHPEKELRQAAYHAEQMWIEIRKISPRILCYQLLGNHCVRAVKRCQEVLPAAQELVKKHMMELYTFDGVRTLDDPRHALWIRDIKFIHGYKKHGDHMKVSHCKTVVGHTHKPGIVIQNDETRGGKKTIIWELNVGWLGNEEKFQDVFGYTPERMTGWTTGIGVIDSYGPRFIALS